MTESLADIEALALKCRSEQSREYIEEALHCYKAGAFRASIVSTWVALVFDLIDKIRELSLADDARAKALETKFDGYLSQIEAGSVQGIKGALEFEREILETCRAQLELFDSQQFLDLERIREDRHRCAHPTFQQVGVPYSPSAEHARLHLRNAIVHVLSQPPVQGKAAIAELKSVVASTYFPTTHSSALSRLRESSLGSGSDPLFRGFVDSMVFGFLTPGSDVFYKPQAISALNAAFALRPAVVEARLRKQLNKAVLTVPDPQFAGAACLASRIPDAWALLEPAAKDKVKKFVETGPKDEVLSGLKTLKTVGDLSDAVEERIKALDLDDLAEAIDPHGVGVLAKERALELLQEAGTWNAANSVFTKAILPLFEFLSRDDIERIIRMPTEHGADLPGANGYRVFIDAVRKQNLIPTAELDELLRNHKGDYLTPQYGDA